MTPSDRTPRALPCAEVLERVEAFVDEDLPAVEMEAVRAHVGGNGACATCARELSLARSILGELRALPEEVCPPEVVVRAFERARGEGAGSGLEAPVSFLRPANDHAPSHSRSWWLGLAAAAAILVTFGLLGLSRLLPNDPATSVVAGAAATDPDAAGPTELDPSTMSSEEIARATEEARLALGLVASIGRRSALVLRDDVVGDNIIGPSARALQRAMEPLQPRATATGAETGDPR